MLDISIENKNKKPAKKLPYLSGRDSPNFTITSLRGWAGSRDQPS